MKERADFTGGILNQTDLRHSVDGGKTWHDGPITGCCAFRSLADDPAAVRRGAVAEFESLEDSVCADYPDHTRKQWSELTERDIAIYERAVRRVLRAAETGEQ